jgi:hypothetical protein
LKLEIATDNDNAELCRFFSQFPVRYSLSNKIKNPARFSLERTDFFAPYRALGSDHTTYILRNPKTRMPEVVASFIVKDTFCPSLNRNAKIAVAMDLRVANSREAVLHWSQHFLPALEQVRKEKDCEFIFSYLNMSEISALNAFVRPRNPRRPLPKYHLYRRLFLTSIHGFYPWSSDPLASLSVRRAEGPLQDALCEYLVKKCENLEFNEIRTVRDLKNYIQRIPGLRLQDFLVALSPDDKIVGCTAPWNTQKNQVQSVLPQNYGRQGQNMYQFLRFARFLGWTRPLSAPGEALDFYYLLFLQADNEDIFESLLRSAFERLGPSSFLLYARLEHNYQAKPPPASISASIPFGIFGLLTPEEAPPEFLGPSFSGEPLLEGFLF